MEINSTSDGILVQEMPFKWAAIVCIVREKSISEKEKEMDRQIDGQRYNIYNIYIYIKYIMY